MKHAVLPVLVIAAAVLGLLGLMTWRPGGVPTPSGTASGGGPTQLDAAGNWVSTTGPMRPGYRT